MSQSNLRHLFAYSQQQKTKTKRGIVYSILNKLFDLAPPVLIGIAIDIVVEGNESFLASVGIPDRRRQLVILAILTFIIWGLESLFDYLSAVTWRGISQDIEHNLRTETFENVLSLDMKYFENKSSGRLMAILNDDVNQLERFLDTGANKLLQTATTVIVIGGTFLYISPLIATFAFIPIPIIIFGSFKFTSTIASRYESIRESIETLNSNLSNSISGILNVKSFTRESKELERIETSSNEVKSANYHAIKLSAAFIPIIRVAILFGFTATLLIGGFLALDGEIKVATYSVLLFITQRLLWPLTELGDTFDLYQRAMASFNRIFSLKNESSEIGNGDIEFKKLENKIELKDVSFSYVDNFNVLNNVDLTIETGQTTAIVGSTGSGKSTLIKLLLRLYEINNGSISYDSNSLKDIELSSLREKIGLVSQDVFLFEGTVIENIAYGDLNASESEVWNAAQKSEADEFINNLPQKEKTIVGERGQKLSGGQRQRISIARAILKNPEILILDEATSSVDNETEAAIHLAKAVTSDGYRQACDYGHEVHAGTGVVREYGLTLFTRQSRSLFHALGEPRYHRKQLAKLMPTLQLDDE